MFKAIKDYFTKPLENPAWDINDLKPLKRPEFEPYKTTNIDVEIINRRIDVDKFLDAHGGEIIGGLPNPTAALSVVTVNAVIFGGLFLLARYVS